MATPLEQTFFALIKAGLHGEAARLSHEPTLQEWAGLLEMAQRQSIIGLLYRGVSFFPDGYPLPEPVLFRLVAEADRVERRGAALRSVAEGLMERLSSAGLHPILMKGPAVAAFYPEPLQREYGDIDIYLPSEEFLSAPAALEVPFTSAPDGSIHYQWEGVDVDQHRRYFDLHRPPQELPGPGTPEAVLLMLSAHALKHACGTGVGLRQCIDMAVAYERLKVPQEKLEDIYRRSGTLRWNRLLSAFIEQYLGFQPPFGGNGMPPDALLDIVLKGGNFGHHAAGRTAALEGSAFRRKADTAIRFLRKLPFSLRFAPRETISSLFSLARGQGQHEEGTFD